MDWHLVSGVLFIAEWPYLSSSEVVNICKKNMRSLG